MKMLKQAGIAVAAVACGAVLCVAALPTSPVSMVLVWDNPGPQYSNLVYRLYANTNLGVPISQWQMRVLTNVVPIDGGTRLASTNSFSYNTWYFALDWTNALWHSSSPFSNVAAPDQLPPTNQTFNLSLTPTP